MKLLKPYFSKEWLEWIRTQKFIILLAAMLFFTFSTPIMLYVLPMILKSQFPELLDLFETSQKISQQNLIGDLYQIFGLVVLFLGYKVFVDEFKKEQFVLPWLCGANKRWVYLSKVLVVFLLTYLLLGFSILLSHFYAGFIFEDFSMAFKYSFYEFLSLSTFISFNLSILFYMSIKKLSPFIQFPMIFLSYFVMPGLIKLIDMGKITPYHLPNFSFESINLPPLWTSIAFICFMVGMGLISIKHPTFKDSKRT